MNLQHAQQDASAGFSPIAQANARVLILGSLPSRASLAAQQYYANPRNAFWKIMRELTGAEGSYDKRCASLRESGVAVWDVLASSIRPGSLDADIRMASAVPNDFDSFFLHHAGIRLVCFNGRKSRQMYQKFVEPLAMPDTLRFALLPSTSPAHASLSLAEKLQSWRGIIEPELE